MAKFNSGDRVRIKDRVDWPSPPGYRLANLEGQVVEVTRPDIVQMPEPLADFVSVHLDKGTNIVVRSCELERV